MINVGAFVAKWPGANREWSKIKTNIIWNAETEQTYYTNVATEIRISLTFYGRRVGDNEDATGFTSN